jgi:hypothetical protein
LLTKEAIVMPIGYRDRELYTASFS